MTTDKTKKNAERRQDLIANLHEVLVGDEEARICKDISDEACRQQPQNFFNHVTSLAATKTGDGLVDPKLVLAWLLGQLGAPAAAIGLLVPIRESLALLPQLATSGWIRSLPQRKYVWSAGSVVQGLSVLAMAGIAASMSGAAAGWSIVGLLAIFALARSACSVSYKDVLGKTVSKQTRGTTTGTAGTIASVAVLLFGIFISTDILPLSVATITIALIVAGSLWIAAGVLFSTLAEAPGATEGGEVALKHAWTQMRYLREDPQLVRFIAVRGFLTATALAPPFLLTLAGQNSSASLSSLGPFVIASSLASISSAYIWGRFADQSSRYVLIVSAFSGALFLALAGSAGAFANGITSSIVVMAALLFGVMVSYQGVRLGRSTHLVDMANEDTRATYTALSNTAIGIILIAGSLFGVLAGLIGPAAVLLLMAAMCLVAGLLAFGLEEVQDD